MTDNRRDETLESRIRAAIKEHNNHRYHVESMLGSMVEARNNCKGDTRIVLTLDLGEQATIESLLRGELAAIDRTLRNAA